LLSACLFTPRFTQGYQCSTPFGVVQNLPICKPFADYADKPYLFFNMKIIILSAAPINIIAKTYFFRFKTFYKGLYNRLFGVVQPFIWGVEPLGRGYTTAYFGFRTVWKRLYNRFFWVQNRSEGVI
jgi:hypothetical protein